CIKTLKYFLKTFNVTYASWQRPTHFRSAPKMRRKNGEWQCTWRAHVRVWRVRPRSTTLQQQPVSRPKENAMGGGPWCRAGFADAAKGPQVSSALLPR